jgi:hypothetical protein
LEAKIPLLENVQVAAVDKPGIVTFIVAPDDAQMMTIAITQGELKIQAPSTNSN